MFLFIRQQRRPTAIAITTAPYGSPTSSLVCGRTPNSRKYEPLPPLQFPPFGHSIVGFTDLLLAVHLDFRSSSQTLPPSLPPCHVRGPPRQSITIVRHWNSRPGAVHYYQKTSISLATRMHHAKVRCTYIHRASLGFKQEGKEGCSRPPRSPK